MSQASSALAIVIALGALTAVGYLLLRDDATAPITQPDPPASPFRPVAADGAVLMRWTTETEQGAQNDLVVMIAEGLEWSAEGALVRYRVGDERFLCYPTTDSMACETDPNPSPLVPTAGKIPLAADEAEPLLLAGRQASCWTFEVDTTTTRTCADIDTGIAVLSETIDREGGELFRQSLAEWGPASASDLAIPPAIAALVD